MVSAIVFVARTDIRRASFFCKLFHTAYNCVSLTFVTCQKNDSNSMTQHIQFHLKTTSQIYNDFP